MASQIACPKCAAKVAGDSVICPRCDFILDPTFLGDDILNDPNAKTGKFAPVDASASEDAVVVGALGEDADLLFSDATGSFLTADTGDFVRRIAPATVY